MPTYRLARLSMESGDSLASAPSEYIEACGGVRGAGRLPFNPQLRQGPRSSRPGERAYSAIFKD